MNKLARQRLSKNLTQTLKYLRLVFNDFFILALIFLVGGLMFWYAKNLRRWPAKPWFGQPLVGFVFWLPLVSGQLVTLLKPADQRFLLPNDRYLLTYLKPMLVYSCLLPFLLLLLVSGLIWPFALLKVKMGSLAFLFLVLSAFLIKASELLLQAQNLYFGLQISFWWQALFALVLLIGATYLPVVFFILSLILFFFSSWLFRQKKEKVFDWHTAIEREQRRKQRVYAWFSLFTDIPEKKTVIHRRKYLDALLPRVKQGMSPNSFLCQRALLRSPIYLNLLVRMTVFAILISWLVQDWRWALGLSAVVIFLTVYQLLPLANEFKENLMYRVYPFPLNQRNVAVVNALMPALLFQWLFISLSWLILLDYQVSLFLAIVILLGLTLILSKVYLPLRLRKVK